MSKVRLTGKITKIGEVEVKETYKMQHIELTISEFDRTTGEPKSEMVYPIALFNTTIDDFKADQWIGKRVQIACYVKTIKSEHEGKVFHNVVLNGTTIVAV